MNNLDYYVPYLIKDLTICFKITSKYFGSLNILKKNKSLVNTKLGGSVYLIANGPSLNNFNINSIFGKDVIVMNHFELADWKDKVNIVAHCMLRR